MGNSCRECETQMAHCHGTLIRHALRRSECTEDGCSSPELVLHGLVIDCDTVGCDCRQQSEQRLAV